ncbi:methyltransferase [Paenibacillus sp. MDMC362]|uniref:methyltransferase n=1 Tax=Paenibacillus sp. MDMC362 TaxID=2977365 RepID=UPI000DC5FD79|nr:methyltransferase [Paenibacillus sp. MDMC362]RAR41867.1 methyltransferase [Paenibacillus sp. MDMC362]
MIEHKNDTKLSESETAGLFLLERSLDYVYSAALRAVALLGVADHLVDGPKTAAELAQLTEADESSLYRVLRLLATKEVFRQNESGQFELTDTAQHLRTDAPSSLRSGVLWVTDEVMWGSIGEIVRNVRGDTFKKIHGKNFFEYWKERGVSSDGYDFHFAYDSFSNKENEFLVRNYDFPNGATVVDVGGNLGALLLGILRRNPTLYGILFDQPHVVNRNRLGELGDDKRWEIAPGDFFKSVPNNGDFYMLKYVIHDWNDEDCIRILRNCREAMAPGGRVLVMDPVIPPGNTPHIGKLLDQLLIGVCEGGRERTEEEFHRLFARAGLRLNRIIDTGCHISIIEAVAD